MSSSLTISICLVSHKYFIVTCNPKSKNVCLPTTNLLPKKNVILCLSFLTFGLKVFIPLLRFPFAKCFMKVASTLSISLVTCGEGIRWIRRQSLKKGVTESQELKYDFNCKLTSSQLPRYELSTISK